MWLASAPARAVRDAQFFAGQGAGLGDYFVNTTIFTLESTSERSM